MSGVGRGRGAVLPAWMKAQGAMPAAPGAAAEKPASPTDHHRPVEVQSSSVGTKRTWDAASIPSNTYHQPAKEYRPTPVIAPTLPEGWSEAYDPHYQRMYYYNATTGERTWIKPEAPKIIPEEPKPQWESAVDPGTGKTYYFNRTTQERVWILPPGAKLVTPPTTAAAAVAEKEKQKDPEEGEALQDKAQIAPVKDTEEAEEALPGNNGAPEDVPGHEESPQPVAKEALGAATVQNLNKEVSSAESKLLGEEVVHEVVLPPGWETAIDQASKLISYFKECSVNEAMITEV